MDANALVLHVPENLAGVLRRRFSLQKRVIYPNAGPSSLIMWLAHVLRRSAVQRSEPCEPGLSREFIPRAFLVGGFTYDAGDKATLAKYLELARAEVVLARDSLKTMVTLLKI